MKRVSTKCRENKETLPKRKSRSRLYISASPVAYFCMKAGSRLKI
ncbi:unnamed protein product [Ixodes pacificus]